MVGDRPRQPARETLTLNVDFNSLSPDPYRFKQACVHGRKQGVPYKKSLFYRCWSSSVKTLQIYIYI